MAVFIKTCAPCQFGKDDWRVKRQGLRVQLVVNEPNDLVHIDLFGPMPVTPTGNVYGFIMIDHFSGLLEVAAIPTKDSGQTCLAFVRHWICKMGAPKKLHSDNGSEFLNEASERMSQLYGINLLFTSGYSPQANGMAENAVKYVKTALLVTSYDKPWQADLKVANYAPWDEMLPQIVASKNATLHPRTGFTPYEAFFGRSLRFPIDVKIGRLPKKPRVTGLENPKQRTIWDFLVTMHQSYRGIHETLTKRQESYRKSIQKHLDKGRKPNSFVVGDKVLVRTDGLSGNDKKFTPLYNGPYTVTSVGANGTTVTLDGGRRAGKSIHVQKIRKYNERDPPAGPTDPLDDA